MDLAVYMIIATFAVFVSIAAVALAWSIAAGQWRDLAGAASIVLAIDDPYPGESGSPADSQTGA
jgi:cbb3-type cytochrome oxidase maturation protein